MFMKHILYFTHLEIPLPKPYGPFHLTFLLGSILTVALFCKFFKANTNRKYDRFVFLFGVFLGLLEVYKQLYFTYIIGNGRYIFDVLPLQLCSIPMYLCLLFPIFKSKKIKRLFSSYIFYYGTLGGIAVMLFPNSVLTEHLSINIHTLVWHTALILLGAFLYKTNYIKICFDEYNNATFLFLTLSLFALVINISAKNFFGKNTFLFFIGPAKNNVFLISRLHDILGWEMVSIATVALICLCGFLFYLITKNHCQKIKSHP